MRTFATKPGQAQKRTPWSVVAAPPPSAHRSYRQPEPQPCAAFSHDLARISIYPPAPRLMQRKLAINEAGDEYEAEADRIAAMVTRTPGTQPAPQCACGTCPDCRQGKAKPAGLQLKQGALNGHAQEGAPPLAPQVLRP